MVSVKSCRSPNVGIARGVRPPAWAADHRFRACRPWGDVKVSGVGHLRDREPPTGRTRADSRGWRTAAILRRETFPPDAQRGNAAPLRRGARVPAGWRGRQGELPRRRLRARRATCHRAGDGLPRGALSSCDWPPPHRDRSVLGDAAADVGRAHAPLHRVAHERKGGRGGNGGGLSAKGVEGVKGVEVNSFSR